LQGQTSEVQRRREGGAVYIECPYTQTESGYTKYWCLQRDGQWQSLVATSSGSKGQSRDKRITVEDDTTRKTVSITMTDLKTEDSGTYSCAVYNYYDLISLRTISLNVFKVPSAHILGVFQGPSSTQSRSQATSLSSENTLVILSVVLFILLLLALVTSTALGVRHYKFLRRAGDGEAEDTNDRAEGTAQPGSTGRRGSSQEDSKGPPYINLDVQSQPSPEDPLYCNVEPSQAHRTPQHVEYAIIAFNQSPRNGRK
ncbi:CLM2 protein, partial [Sterrhoptilus dennistouni]|nr:CLM2 protein [Sterrhoptilus dennistouni]